MAAEGTGGIGQKPSVYTIDMKRMLAVGEQPEMIFFTELTQAYCTICTIFEATNCSIQEHRKCVNEGLVQSSFMESQEVLQLTTE